MHAAPVDVLLVAAEPELRRYLKRCLEPLAGWIGTVHEHDGVAGALETARTLGVALVVIDDVRSRFPLRTEPSDSARSTPRGIPSTTRRPTIVQTVVPPRLPTMVRLSELAARARPESAGLDTVSICDGRTLRQYVEAALERRREQ